MHIILNPGSYERGGYSEKRCGYGSYPSLGDDLKCELLGLTGEVQKHKRGAELPSCCAAVPWCAFDGSKVYRHVDS